MAWIYLAESEDSPWPFRHGCGQSPTVKTTDTLNPYFFLAWLADTFLPRLSGMTSVLSRAIISHKSTLPTAVSRARTSAKLALVKAWLESEAGSFLRSSGSSESLDQLSFSLRTYPKSEPMAALKSSGRLPNSGMIVDGQFTQRPHADPGMSSESELGFWVSITTNDGHGGNGSAPNRYQRSLRWLARNGRLPGHPKGSFSPEWSEQAMGYHKGWTELEPWATAWFRSARAKRSKD